MAQDHHAYAARERRPLLLPAEAISLIVIAAIAILDVALSTLRGIPVDLVSFAPKVLLALVMGGVALGYRATQRNERIPLALVACAILILFSNAGAILNYLVVPAGRPTIDPLLTRADGALGFDWQAFTSWIDGRPTLGRFLALIYLSSLGQMAAVVMVLGLTGRQQSLHRFLACGMLASLAAIVIWTCAPSIGPAPWASATAHSGTALKLVLGPEYTAQMHALLHSGPTSVSADRLLGLIAFPSMHSVMMAMALSYTRGSRAFIPLAALNLPMIPAILVHGSHHLVDVLGGLMLFAAAAALSAQLVRPARAASKAPVGVAPAPRHSPA